MDFVFHFIANQTKLIEAACLAVLSIGYALHVLAITIQFRTGDELIRRRLKAVGSLLMIVSGTMLASGYGLKSILLYFFYG